MLAGVSTHFPNSRSQADRSGITLPFRRLHPRTWRQKLLGSPLPRGHAPRALWLVALLGLTNAVAAAGRGDVAPVPEVFAPGVISSEAHDAAPAFTPDGQTVYFTRSDGQHSTILVSHRRDGAWTEPETAPFSGTWNDMEPAMAPDGRFLIFISNRPAASGGAALDGVFNGHRVPGGGGNLWRVTLTAGGWDTPARLPGDLNGSTSTFAPAVAEDGSLYFMRPAATTGRFQLWYARFADGKYQAPQPLPWSDGTTTDVDPAVAADQSFLVFGSGRPPALGMDLFIVHRKAGAWGAPIHLGTTVNSPGSDAEARLAPDGRTLYFSSERPALPTNGPRPAWDNGKYNIWRVSLAPWLKPR